MTTNTMKKNQLSNKTQQMFKSKLDNKNNNKIILHKLETKNYIIKNSRSKSSKLTLFVLK